MHFTYESYSSLISLLKAHGYSFVSYDTWQEQEGRCVIMRHDIDNDPSRSLRLAQLEASHDIHSVYFVLLTSDFYNVFSRRSREHLRGIIELGHEIGLHFDPAAYPGQDDTPEKLTANILREAELLSKAISHPVKFVSMHRPGRKILEADLEIPGMINAYSKPFYSRGGALFKYLSDSRRLWREPAEEIITSEKFSYLHILTHAFWYHDQEKDLRTTLADYINSAAPERYAILSENIKDLAGVISPEEINPSGGVIAC